MNIVELRRRVRFIAVPAVVSVLVLGVATPVLAQRDGVIAGKVTGADGQPVEGARVIIISVDRGDQREFRTDSGGDYMARGFRPEEYLVQVEAEGYGAAQEQLKVNFGTNTVDFQLVVATAQPDVDFAALNALYEEGYNAYEVEDWARAEAVLTQLISGMEGVTGDEAVRMRESSYEILGRSYLELGDNESAVTAYRAMLEINPDSVSGHAWISQALTRDQRFEEALPHLRRGVELAPDDASLQYNAGAVMLQLNEVEEGIAAMERAVELRPEFPLARKNLGYAYLRTQEFDKAIELLKSYLELAPEAPDRAEVEQMIAALEAQQQG